MKHLLISSILIFISFTIQAQDWGLYNSLRGRTDWEAKRRAKEAELRLMEEQSRLLDYYYGISCNKMANDVLKYGTAKATLDKTDLKSKWLYEVTIYKTIYTSYEVIAYMYNNDQTDIKGYLYCHVSAANWNAFVDKNNKSTLSINERFYRYIHNVDKYQCLQNQPHQQYLLRQYSLQYIR